MSLPQEWMRRLCTGSTASVLRLYNEHAILLPTFESGPLIGKKELAAYFNDFVGQKPGLCGLIDSQATQSLNGAIVISGIYSFYWNSGGAQKHTAARYTFVCTPLGIMTHHSSQIP